MKDEWIWIPHWDGPDGFQHYRDRDPIWIKNYTRLLSHDAYMSLSFASRGLLHGIWVAYAMSSRRLPGSTLVLSRRLGGQVKRRSLESLVHAGFVEIIASDVLAARLQDASPHARPRDRERHIEQTEVDETPKGVSSSTTTRSEETPTPHQPVNGRAALPDDIPLPSQAWKWPCEHCDRTFDTHEDAQVHVAVDHHELGAHA